MHLTGNKLKTLTNYHTFPVRVPETIHNFHSFRIHLGKEEINSLYYEINILNQFRQVHLQYFGNNFIIVKIFAIYLSFLFQIILELLHGDDSKFNFVPFLVRA